MVHRYAPPLTLAASSCRALDRQTPAPGSSGIHFLPRNTPMHTHACTRHPHLDQASPTPIPISRDKPGSMWWIRGAHPVRAPPKHINATPQSDQLAPSDRATVALRRPPTDAKPYVTQLPTSPPCAPFGSGTADYTLVTAEQPIPTTNPNNQSQYSGQALSTLAQLRPLITPVYCFTPSTAFTPASSPLTPSSAASNHVCAC